jgi:hypothetical protein
VSRRKSTGQELGKGPPEQKQQTNIYTIMLIISFAAICIACTLLWLELQEYGPYPWWKTDGVSPASTSQAAPVLSSPAWAFAEAGLGARPSGIV